MKKGQPAFKTACYIRVVCVLCWWTCFFCFPFKIWCSSPSLCALQLLKKCLNLLDQLKLERGDLFCAKPCISGKLSEKWYFYSLSGSHNISSEHSGFWWWLVVIWRCPLARCLVLIGRASGSFLMSKGSTVWVINATCMETTGREGLISGFQSLVKYFS